MSDQKPTRTEIETSVTAADRGWTVPRLPQTSLDFAVAIFLETRDRGVTLEYGEDGSLAGYRGLKLKD